MIICDLDYPIQYWVIDKVQQLPCNVPHIFAHNGEMTATFVPTPPKIQERSPNVAGWVIFHSNSHIYRCRITYDGTSEVITLSDVPLHILPEAKEAAIVFLKTAYKHGHHFDVS